MKWIAVGKRVPNNRRFVIAWGTKGIGSIYSGGRGECLGITRFNPSSRGGEWDIEIGRWARMWGIHVSHWAEITSPYD